MVKGVYNCLWKTHRRATERYLPYGITQCYLLADTSERAPKQTDTRFIYPSGMKG